MRLSHRGAECVLHPAVWDVKLPKPGKTSEGLRVWSSTCTKSIPPGCGGCIFPTSEHLALCEFLCLSQSTLGILFPASPAAPFGKHRPANCRQLQAERKILSLNQRGHLFSASFSGDSGGNKGTLSSPFRPQILIF